MNAAATPAPGCPHARSRQARRTTAAIEASNAGIDTVQHFESYTLPANLENLTLLGTGNTSATGNAAANVLVGNAGANQLEGSLGNDGLTGNEGADTVIGGGGTDTLDYGQESAQTFATPAGGTVKAVVVVAGASPAAS